MFNIEREETLYEKNRRLRRERMEAAKRKGTHTKEEWQEMKDFFQNTCVKCLGESQLIRVSKDHITPIYQGGSDGLDNLQPLCMFCNTSKGPENFDYRPYAAAILGLVLPEKYKRKKNG